MYVCDGNSCQRCRLLISLTRYLVLSSSQRGGKSPLGESSVYIALLSTYLDRVVVQIVDSTRISSVSSRASVRIASCVLWIGCLILLSV